MKKFFLFAAALMTGSAVMADTESYVAAIDASTMASVFPVEEITSGSSVVSFSTANMDVLAVGGATPKTILADGTVTEWNAISWQPKRMECHLLAAQEHQPSGRKRRSRDSLLLLCTGHR